MSGWRCRYHRRCIYGNLQLVSSRTSVGIGKRGYNGCVGCNTLGGRSGRNGNRQTGKRLRPVRIRIRPYDLRVWGCIGGSGKVDRLAQAITHIVPGIQ